MYGIYQSVQFHRIADDGSFTFVAVLSMPAVPGCGTVTATDVDVAPDGAFYGTFACSSVADTYYWGVVDPATAVITPLHTLLPYDPFRSRYVKFVAQFPAAAPLGYRLRTTSPDNTPNTSTDPLEMYAVDALSPYRDHLVAANIVGAGSSITNTGIGTVIEQDGSGVYWVTRNTVYWRPISPPPDALVVLQGLGQLNLGPTATVGGFKGTGGFPILFEGHMWLADPWNEQISLPMQTMPSATQLIVRRAPLGGVRITPDEGLVTTESGGSATFIAVLTVQPTANVTVNFASTDTTEGTVAPASATFTTTNWNTPQPITVTGALDHDTANQAFTITTASTSPDPNYHERGILDVDVVNTHVNQAPSMTAGSPTAQQGVAPATATLGAASDFESAAGSLTAATVTVPSGVTVGAITNTSGTITAPLSASCNAAIGDRTLTLRVTDPHSATFDRDVTVAVTANTAPTLGPYGAATAAHGGGTVAAASAPPNDNVSGSLVTVSSATFTGGLSVNAVNGTVTATNAAPGGVHTVTVTVTDNCGATVVRTFDLTVSCPAVQLASSGATFTIGGGNGSAGVTAASGCDWSSSSPVSWIAMETGGGTGSGAATFTVQDNRTGAPRQADLTIGAQPFTVTQQTGFSDTTITGGATIIRALHVRELRIRIDLLRASLGMVEYAWTDGTITGGTSVRAVHLTDLRTALLQAYTEAGQAPPSFTDEIVAGVTAVRAVHVTELRNAVEALAALGGP